MPRGAKPKPPGEAVTRHAKVHEFVTAEAPGWQHGDTPKPPARMLGSSREAWDLWFGSWWASFWSPEDVPALRRTLQLFDVCSRDPESKSGPELRQMLDRYGITPKGRQDLRWQPPKDKPAATTTAPSTPRLRVVDKAG